MTTFEFTYQNRNTNNVKVSFSGEDYSECVAKADAHRKVLKAETGLRHTLINREKVA